MTVSKSGRGRAPEGAATDQKGADDLAQGEPLIPPPDHPAHVPAGDPGREWRRRRRWIDAPGFGVPDGQEILAQHGSDELLDVWFGLMEWGLMSADPELRALSRRGIQAGEALLRCETDETGRAIPLGRLIGLQPPGPGGLSAGQAVTLRRRNALIRQARAAHPDWRAMTDRQAARDLVAAFSKYEATGWPVDRKRDTAPAGDPVRAVFWRIKRSGAAMPDAPRVAQLLA